MGQETDDLSARDEERELYNNKPIFDRQGSDALPVQFHDDSLITSIELKLPTHVHERIELKEEKEWFNRSRVQKVCDQKEQEEKRRRELKVYQ